MVENFLKNSGFVRVDGLTVSDFLMKQNFIIEKSDKDFYDENNSIQAVGLASGRIWVRPALEEIPTLVTDSFKRGGFVPLSNGESVNTFQLLKRVANSDCEFK